QPGATCSRTDHTESRCFFLLNDLYRAEHGEHMNTPDWLALLKQDIDVFACDWVVIHAGMYAMYAASASVEEDCYLCVPRVARVEAASLGAFDSASTGAEPEEALHTFTLDSSASRCFFRDSTTVTPLIVPLPVTLADPSWGPVVARGATVLPCPTAVSGLLTGLHLPLFAKNLLATSVLQDQWVIVTQPGGELVAICQVAASIEVASSCSCRLLTHQTLHLHHRLGHPSLPRLCGMHSRLVVSGHPRSLPLLPRSLAPPCLPCVEGWQRAAPHSSSFPPTTAPLQTLHMDIRAVRLQLRARFQQDLPVLQLHSDQGGEFCSRLLEDFCGAEGIVQSYTLPASQQQNGIVERHIGLVMELNLWPRVSHPETSPTLRWTGEVVDASAFRFYHSGSRRVLSSRDVTFDESVCFYRLHPHRSSPVPLSPLSLEDDPTPVAPLPPPGPAPSDTSGPADGGDPTPAATVTPRRSARLAVPPGFPPRPSSPPLQPVIVDSGAAEVVPLGVLVLGALSPERLCEWAVHWGSPGGGASHLRAGGVGTAGAGGAGTAGAGVSATGGTGIARAGSTGARRRKTLSPERLREWAVKWGSPGGGASRARSPRAGGTGGAAVVGSGSTGVSGASRQESLSPLQLREWAVRWGSPGGGAGGIGYGGAVATGAVGSGGATTQLQLSVLRHLLTLPPAATEFPVAGVPGTHRMALCPSSGPQRVVLLSPHASSVPHVPDPESYLVRTASSTVTCLLATVVTDPSFDSAATSALVAELADFASLCRLDYAASLVFYSSCPPSAGGELALGCYVLEDRQFELECLAAAAPHLASTLLCPERDPDALDIPTPRTYAEAITGSYYQTYML
ncbi:unnamed protein product, partial [Closterium sp. NIES-54]